MTKVYLFDWGDTLMVDRPEQSGKMCDWETVEAVDGAIDVLKTLSHDSIIYVATNAQDSSEEDIRLAFERVGLSPYINGYFCMANLGIGKGSPEFYYRIIEHLKVEPSSIIMVGDTFDKDIEPAIVAGIQTVWFNPKRPEGEVAKGVRHIQHLSQLCQSPGFKLDQ